MMITQIGDPTYTNRTSGTSVVTLETSDKLKANADKTYSIPTGKNAEDTVGITFFNPAEESKKLASTYFKKLPNGERSNVSNEAELGGI